MHRYYDYLEEINEYSILDDFLNDTQGRQSWTPLISPRMYQKALNEFTKYGKFVNFPTKYLYQWMGIIMRNTAKLRANTNWAGHSSYFPFQEFLDFFVDEEDEEAREKYDGNYEACSEHLDEIGFYDWMIAPDGSDAYSDFGIEPIEELIMKYDENMPLEELIVLINKVLDVYHCRGDLSSLFIEGGRKTLSKISNGELAESRKTIYVTEEQFKKLLLL